MKLKLGNAFNIALILILVVCAFLLKEAGLTLVGILLIGIALGIILQRSRFCIASAFSDVLLFKDTKLLMAVVLFVLISSWGFAVIQISGGEGFVVAIGWRTVLGGIMFGSGMALAGGCAVGTLMRLGEGYLLFIPALIGLIIGATLGAYHYDYWGTPAGLKYSVFLPDFLGWGGAIVIESAVLIGIWLLLWLIGRSR